jgi:hypothetical protein
MTRNLKEGRIFCIIQERVDTMIILKNGTLSRVKRISLGCLASSRTTQLRNVTRKSMNLSRAETNFLKRS